MKKELPFLSLFLIVSMHGSSEKADVTKLLKSVMSERKMMVESHAKNKLKPLPKQNKSRVVTLSFLSRKQLVKKSQLSKDLDEMLLSVTKMNESFSKTEVSEEKKEQVTENEHSYTHLLDFEKIQPDPEKINFEVSKEEIKSLKEQKEDILRAIYFAPPSRKKNRLYITKSTCVGICISSFILVACLYKKN